jgi:hypothetical protein
MRFPWRALVIALVCRSQDATAQQHDAHSLGTVRMTINCSAAAQAEFNRGVALLHHMTYPQALTAFERVASLRWRNGGSR